MPEERVLTPGGFRPKSLVHRVERVQGLRSTRNFVHKFDLASGALVELPKAELRFAEVPALGSGWITYPTGTTEPGVRSLRLRRRGRFPPPLQRQQVRRSSFSMASRISEQTMEFYSRCYSGATLQPAEANTGR